MAQGEKNAVWYSAGCKLNQTGNQSVVTSFCPQVKYKEDSRNEVNKCLYSTLPDTLDTQHARDATQLLSEVRGRSPAARARPVSDTCVYCVRSEKVQRGRQEGDVPQPFLHPERHVGNETGQRDDGHPERGDASHRAGRLPNHNPILRKALFKTHHT